MGVAAGIGAVGTIIGGAISSDASRSAAHTQADSQRQAMDVQEREFNQNLDWQKQALAQELAIQQPFVDAGKSVLPALTAGTAPGGKFNKPYTLADFESGPQEGLFKFAKDQALEAMTNKLGSTGQGNTTNDVVGAGKLASNLAGQYFDTGFSENLAQNQFTLNSLLGLLGVGENASNMQTGAVLNTSANVTNAMSNNATAQATGLTNIGNANAGGIIGKSNAIGGAISGIGSDAATAYMLKNYFTKPNTTSVGMGSGAAANPNAYEDMAAFSQPVVSPIGAIS